MAAKVYALIGTIVVIAAVGIATVFVVLPSMQEEVAEFELVLVDYGYNKAGFGPTLTVKVGQLIRLRLSNEGTQTHEFMLVAEKDMSLMMMKNMVGNILESMNLTAEEADLDAPEWQQALMMYNEMHEGMVDQMAVKDASGNPVQFELEPDESGIFEFRMDEPGTYWFVCHNAGGTFPEIHQDRGMFGKLIVEEA
jgi:uncharacterized cupredoxin-like copper-binding protein